MNDKTYIMDRNLGAKTIEYPEDNIGLVYYQYPPIIAGLADSVTNAFAQHPYHGKAAAAGSTISSLAKTLGWDETIWDLSRDVPVLK